MQIKPHQAAHIAEQQRRFKIIGLQLAELNRGVITEYSSYFSRRFFNKNMIGTYAAILDADLDEKYKYSYEKMLEYYKHI